VTPGPEHEPDGTSKGRDHDNEPEPDEGGDGWTEQNGYGERVLDPDEGEDAATTQADNADDVEDHS